MPCNYNIQQITQTVSRTSTTHCALDYRNIDRVELKAGGAHIVVNPITVFVK